MSQTSALKSAAITQLDTQPPFASTAGEGAAGYLEEIDGSVTCLTADVAASTYKLIRLKSNAKIKKIWLDTAALGSGTTLNLGAYYSDSPYDGTDSYNQGVLISSNFFVSALSVAAANTGVDVTNSAGNYPINLRTQPLWQTLGLSADPGGFIDLVASPPAGVTTGGLIGITVDFVR